MAERLPKERKEYLVMKGTNQLFYGVKFWDGNKFFFQEGDLPVRFWLEEIELPTDEQIGKQFKYKSNVGYPESNINGAKWLRDFVLAGKAVTPINTNANGA